MSGGAVPFRRRVLTGVVASLAALALTVSCANSGAPQRRSAAGVRASASASTASASASAASEGIAIPCGHWKPLAHMPTPGGKMPSGTAMERILARGRADRGSGPEHLSLRLPQLRHRTAGRARHRPGAGRSPVPCSGGRTGCSSRPFRPRSGSGYCRAVRWTSSPTP
ncbi:hypothetical protein ACRAWF_14410 [Streptomyces sp. L7]